MVGTFEIAASQSRHLSQSTAVDILSSESSCGIAYLFTSSLPVSFFHCVLVLLTDLSNFCEIKNKASELVRDRYLSRKRASRRPFSLGFALTFPCIRFAETHVYERVPPSLSVLVWVLRDLRTAMFGAWVAWRMRTFFIPCLASCIIFMPNRGEMVFSAAVSVTAGEKEIYYLRGKRRDIYIILLQFVLTVYRSVFRVCRGKKKRKNDSFSFFRIFSYTLIINKNRIP